jgi:ubiquinone/menaquinone biosynthesis C-methylase UbiE
MQSNKYYQISKIASCNIGNHPGLISIQRLANKSKNILDVGCGEGTRLDLFVGKGKTGTGVDVSPFAINSANKQYPHHKFLLINGENLPFSNESFDLVYSTFVLEHTRNQKLFIQEIIRVTKKNGMIAILCPNYGSPNRRSPVSNENPILKIIKGSISNFIPRKFGLEFAQVIPKNIFKDIDDDTTCEPYIYTILEFIKHKNNLRITQSSSLWEIDNDAKSIHQRIFRYLGQKNIFPFKYWGPQLFVVINKID